jgi:hypothetical protein
MKPYLRVASCLLVLLIVGACASVETTGRRSYDGGQNYPRPTRIIVYDFAATADDVAASSAITGKYKRRSIPQSANEIRLGRELGRRVAVSLVRKILAMRLPAERFGAGPLPQIGDYVVTGEFVSIDEGDRTQRMIIGFGAGANKLMTAVEKYRITPTGPQLVSAAEFSAKGGKAPGMAVPLIIMGGIFGRPVQAAVISGAVNILQELGPEHIQAAADRTASEIADHLRDNFRRRGWI